MPITRYCKTCRHPLESGCNEYCDICEPSTLIEDNLPTDIPEKASSPAVQDKNTERPGVVGHIIGMAVLIALIWSAFQIIRGCTILIKGTEPVKEESRTSEQENGLKKLSPLELKTIKETITNNGYGCADISYVAPTYVHNSQSLFVICSHKYFYKIFDEGRGYEVMIDQ